MSEVRAFEPLYGPTGPTGAQGTLSPSVTVTATNVSATASTVFPGTQTNYKQQIQVANTTTAWAYVSFGTVGNVVAATVAASFPVAPGVSRTITVDKEVTGASVILGTVPGTNTAVIFTRGEGL